MLQPLNSSEDVQGNPGEGKEANQEKLGLEFTTMNISPARAPSPAMQVPKHGLHGLRTGLAADSSRQRAASKNGPPQRVPAPAPAPLCLESASLKLGVELASLAEHYAVGACVVTLSRDEGSIQVLARHGLDLDFDMEQGSLDSSSSGFRFFRHHVTRDLPIIVADTSKQRGLERHPLVVGVPFIAFYAAAPLIVGPSAYAGTLSIFDSSPRPDFTLQDCEVLQQVASKVAEIVMQMR